MGDSGQSDAQRFDCNSCPLGLLARHAQAQSGSSLTDSVQVCPAARLVELLFRSLDATLHLRVGIIARPRADSSPRRHDGETHGKEPCKCCTRASASPRSVQRVSRAPTITTPRSGTQNKSSRPHSNMQVSLCPRAASARGHVCVSAQVSPCPPLHALARERPSTTGNLPSRAEVRIDPYVVY